MITQLIDKIDNFEIVRDKIADILANEVASQMAKASAAGQDPVDYNIRVFTERAIPWSELNEANPTPICNVWFDGDVLDGNASNSVERQRYDAVYNIDCYCYGASGDNAAGGHFSGDEQAARNAHKTMRLLRNIVMAGRYTYLDLLDADGQRIVEKRMIVSRSVFQPQQDGRFVDRVIGARLVLKVRFNETSYQVTGEVLEVAHTDLQRGVNGEIIAQAEYDYTTQ